LKDDVELGLGVTGPLRCSGWHTDVESATPGSSPRCTPAKGVQPLKPCERWTPIRGDLGPRRAGVAQTTQLGNVPPTRRYSARLDAIDQPKGEYHHGSSSPSPLGPCFTIELKLPFPTESFPIRVSNNISDEVSAHLKHFIRTLTPVDIHHLAMEGHGGSDSWASMRDKYQPQTHPHPSDHSIHSSTSNSSLPQFHSGDGGTYNYHHGRQSFPGEQLHNSSPSYYQPNQPGTGHTMGSPAVDGNPPGIGPQGTPRLLGHWAITDPAIRLDRKAMVINQVGEAPTTVPQGRRGNPYNIKFPNRPPQSPHTYPCHERANELISYAIGTTPVGPLGRNSSTDSGGIGPICSPRIGTGGASPSLYRHKGRQLFSDDFSSSCEFDRQSTSSGGYQSRDSQHSRDLDTPPASLRPETATWIWENFKALRDCVGKPEEMVKMAQPLFNIPENERWPASVVMQLCWLGSFADIPQVALEKAAALKGQPFTSLTTFITTTVRRVLLSPELDSFSRQSSLKNAGGKTPYSLV
ncbi:hypothetical protein MJO28_007162, partial [Puccinia striiformis f. sp. tritici]